VYAVVSGDQRWTPGDRVMGIVGGGGYAEAVVVHGDEAIPVPERLSLTEAAAVPEVFLTAHDALFTLAQLQPAETVVIHAVGSGVGTAALQLARAHGARVIGTARSSWKLERARSLGLAVAVDSSHQDFVDVVRVETADTGANVFLDLVGGDLLGRNLAAAAIGARVIIVGLVGGSAAPLDMRLLMRKRALVRGTVMRARGLAEKIAVARAFERDALPWLAAGRVVPVIDRVLPMAEAAQAHALLEQNETFGKVVLAWE
jgi:NADPH:quinone reductase-like Zn-dependent oxidoreductase